MVLTPFQSKAVSGRFEMFEMSTNDRNFLAPYPGLEIVHKVHFNCSGFGRIIIIQFCFSTYKLKLKKFIKPQT